MKMGQIFTVAEISIQIFYAVKEVRVQRPQLTKFILQLQ